MGIRSMLAGSVSGAWVDLRRPAPSHEGKLMKRSILLSFIGSALAALAITVGCGSDEKASTPATSAKGESCTRSSDCASGLACVANVCDKLGGTITLPDGGMVPGAGGG